MIDLSSIVLGGKGDSNLQGQRKIENFNKLGLAFNQRQDMNKGKCKMESFKKRLGENKELSSV